MKTLSFSKTEAGDIIYTTDYGTFTKELTNRGYSVHNYRVVKLTGDWPEAKEVAKWCDERVSYFGGSATIQGDAAGVTCYVD